VADILDGDYEARVDLDRLATHPRNPRRGNIGRLEQLIDANGFHGALLCQRSTGFILAGNHRMLAARARGLTELPVLWVDVDDGEALRILLGDNRASDDAAYDDETLAALLSELEATDAGLTGTGYTDADLEALLNRIGADVAPTGSTEPDDAPPLADGPPISHLGDVWLLGRHRLVVGDARDPNVIERALAGRLADMIFTDPPYGVAYLEDVADNPELQGRRKQRTDGLVVAGDARNPDDLELLLRAALGNCRTWARPGAAFWVCGPSNPPMLPVFAAVLDELKVWRQTVVWVKDVMILGRQDYQGRHEILYEGEVPGDVELGASRLDPDLLAVGWKSGAAHHPPPDRRGDNVWEIPRPKASKDHPTMKPVALIERAVRNHTDPAEIVLDAFAGSGSTLIACHRAGRAACLVELDPRYADVICRRWEDHVGVPPRRDGDADPITFRGLA
jgi:DNA modification methylase